MQTKHLLTQPRWLTTIILLLFGIAHAWGAETLYETLTMADNGSDSGTAFTTKTTINSSFATPSDSISAITSVSKVYPGNGGWKFGSSSAAGSITITLAHTIKKVTKIVVNVQGYNTSGVNLNCNSIGVQKTSSTSFADKTYTYASATDVSSITLVTSKPSKGDYRCRVKYIKIYYDAPAASTSVSLTKAGQTNGSFTLTQGGAAVTSVTTTSAAQTVTITASPSAGYYLSNVTATDPAGGSNLTVSGSGNTRTVTYAVGKNGSSTITTTFSCITPTISASPSNGSCTQGGSPTPLTVTATQASGTMSYQWQQCATSGGTYVNVSGGSGGTTASYTPPTSSVGTTYYKCVVTNSSSGCSTSATSSYASFVVTASSSTWKFKYSGDSWTEHTMTESAGVASFSISLAADSRYEFGFDDNGSAFYKNNGTIITTTSGWTFNTSDNNCKIHTGPAGTYTFAINTTTKAVTVTYPTVDHPNDHYVYFKNTNVWGTVYGYLANSGNDNKAAAWPGSVMQATTTICGETYHYAALNAMSGTYNTIIFNNGSSGYGNQTSDLSTTGSLGKYNANTDATWHDFKYSITFAANGGTGTTASVTNICSGSNATLTANGFSKTGYTFDGWTPSASVTVGSKTYTTSDVVPGGSTIKAVSRNLTMTAHWAANTISLTLDKNNNDASGSTNGSASVKYDATALVSSPTHATRTGYTLEGYYAEPGCTNKVLTSAGALVNYTGYVVSGKWARTTTPTTLYAKWTPVNYTVTWYAGGSAAGNITTAGGPSTSVAYNSKVTKLPTTPSGAGCDKTFVGWTNTTSYTHGTSPLFTDAAGSPAITGATNFYAVFAEEGEVVDTLYYSKIGIAKKASYTNWSGKTSASSAVYAGNSTGGTDDSGNTIQLRTTNSNSGIVSTTSGGKIKKIKVVWNSYTTDTRTLDIYGANTAYTAPTQLYSTPKGEKLGSIEKGTSTELSPTTDSTYIGLRSNSGAMYIDSIYITWTTSTGHTITCASCSNSVTVSYSAPGSGNAMTVKKGSTNISSGDAVKTCSAVNLTVTLTPASHYSVTSFTATGVTGVTTSNVGNVYTVSIPADKTGTLTLTPTFTEDAYRTIVFKSNNSALFNDGGSATTFDGTNKWKQKVYLTEKPVWPTNLAAGQACDGTSTAFMGWVKSTWTGKESSGMPAGKTLITAASGFDDAASGSGDVVYHAVWAKATEGSNWELVTSLSNIQEGNAYLGSYHSYSGTRYYGATSNSATKNVTVSGSPLALSSTDGLKQVSIVATSNANEYYIKDGTNYLYANGTGSAPSWSATACAWTFSNINGNYLFKVKSSLGTYYLRAYATSTTDGALKMYGDETNSGICLFQKPVSYSDYMTTCCDKYVTLSAGSPSNGTVTFSPAGPIATCGGDKDISLTITPAAGYQLTGWTVATGSGKVAAKTTSPAIATSNNNSNAQNITLTFAEDDNGTYSVTPTFGVVTPTAVVWKYNSAAIPNPINLYVGQTAALVATYTPAGNLLVSAEKNYTVTKSSGLTEVSKTYAVTNPTYTFRADAVMEDGTVVLTNKNHTTLTTTVHVHVDPLPRVHFVDLVHGKEFADVVATIADNALNASKTTKTSVDWTTPNYNDCETNHLHLVGWIREDWPALETYLNGGAQPSTTAITGAGNDGSGNAYYFEAGAAINVLTFNGVTFYAVWAKVE